MKKIANLSFIYMIMGLVGGVFYREFTKFNGFTGTTQLSVIHTHLLMLGMFMMLIILILIKLFKINEHKGFKRFMMFYNGGLHLTVLMMLIRGIVQVIGTDLSKGLNAAISGMSGLGHIALAIGLVYLFISLKAQIALEEK
ncbi:DUF2871 domain-containing protein [Erysipelothrix sp. HDW6C]|uniref:DUF2871 domain-containing protein n=1 Tax=Erysipelothrix sp. HDW6C TaxID=2714930 RepID=UPI00140A58BB|nr:DUF2871 domain-containing protein [Erysipelothrix sp. HDW6C]QIK69988.1 DUF2871 domain-containing protein [Erysipelothrix sp. HDW6C]